MSDISLSFGPLEYLVFLLVTAAPAIGIGVVCGALAWRRRRWLGGGIGALVGFAVGALGFIGWRDSRLSISIDYWTAVRGALLVAAPGGALGAALGGWRWRSERARGAVVGGLAGATLDLALWVAIRGGF